MTGAPLKFQEVSGAEARESGLANAGLDSRYIRVELARPVPQGGEGRIRIIKTYKDPKSYFRDGEAIVFDRPLGIKRNSVVLPPGYELVSCNIPSQVIEETDGRVGISFMNTYPGQAPLVIRASAARQSARRKRPRRSRPRVDSPRGDAWRSEPGAAADGASPRLRARVPGSRDRLLPQEPETHAFSLYHDYTETREGIDKYVNVVRAGSTVSDPSAKILDTGESSRPRRSRARRSPTPRWTSVKPCRPESEIVLIRFPAVKKGQSVRLRIEETYTDPARYDLVDGQLMWRRSFGRPRNDIVLPAGWYLTASSIPATISQTEDGRVRLAFVNPRPDNIEVFVKGRRK